MKPHGRVTGVFGKMSGRGSRAYPPRLRLPAHTDTIPLRVLHVEVRGTKGDGDGHPSLR